MQNRFSLPAALLDRAERRGAAGAWARGVGAGHIGTEAARQALRGREEVEEDAGVGEEIATATEGWHI